MVSFAPFSFRCTERYHSLTSLGLIPGTMLALMVHYTFFARLAPRKVAAVGVVGDVELSRSQGFSYLCLLCSSSPGTENKHETHGSVHSRVQVRWIGYFIFWERLKFAVCMKTKCWFISLVSTIITSPFHQSLRSPTM